MDNLKDWEARELIELQDTSLLFDVNSRKKKRKACISNLHNVMSQYPNIFAFEDITEENISRCWSIVETRAFAKIVPYLSLIPLADLFNHSNSNTTYNYARKEDLSSDYDLKENDSWDEDEDDPVNEDPLSITLSSQKLHKLNFIIYETQNDLIKRSSARIEIESKKIDGKVFMKKLKTASLQKEKRGVVEDEEKAFRIFAGKFEIYEAGAQVYVPYGRYSNRTLLTEYGFVLARNKYDHARVKLPLNQLLRQIQLEKLSKNYNPKMTMAFKIKKTRLNLELIGVLRSLMFDPAQNRHRAFFYPFDLDLELEVITKAKRLLETVLLQSPTDVETDENLLNSAEGRYHLAILYRISLKECLIGQISLLDIALKTIQRIKEHTAGEEQKTCKINPYAFSISDPDQMLIKEYLDSYNF